MRRWLEQSRTPAERGPAVAWIPHGVDQTTFVPLRTLPDGQVDPAGRVAARLAILGADAASGVSFLVLNGNRHVPRKRLDATLRVFAAFASDKPPSVKLLLKSSDSNPQRSDLENLVRASGLGQRVLWTDALGIADTLDDSRLNLLYNACNVGISTSEGEGWGLVAFEHAAAGVPQILPAHAAADLWSGYPGLIGTARRRVAAGDMFSYAEVDETAAGAVLQRFYEDDGFRSEASLHGLRIARQPEVDWSSIGRRWQTLITGLRQVPLTSRLQRAR